jgi:hypothetical protein
MVAVTKELSLSGLKDAVSEEWRQREVITALATGIDFVTDDNDRVLFSVGSRKFGVTYGAFQNLGHSLGIPKTITEKFGPELVRPLFMHQIREGKEGAYSAVIRNNVVEGFSVGQLNPVMDVDVIDAVVDVVNDRNYGTLGAHHISFDPFLSTYSITRALDHEIAVNDPVRTGLTVSNSITGSRRLEVSAYVHRLICTNGAISATNSYKFSGGKFGDKEEDRNEWLRRVIGDAFDAADEEVERLRTLRNVRFEGHLSESLNSIYSELSVPVAMRNALTDMVIDGNAETGYDIYNMITDIASNSPIATSDANLSYRMMRVGGKLAESTSFCGGCHRILPHASH